MVRSYYREPCGGVTEVLAEQRRYSLFGITSINCVVSATESLTETTTEPADGEAVAVGGGGGEEVPDDSESGDSAGDADSPPAPPTPATAGPAGTNPGECAGYVAPVAGPESTCYSAPTVSMSQPEIGLASTVYITAAPNTEFLKITCHQPVGEEEVCSAFVRETDANGHFAGETEMLMGPGSWTEIVCLPVDKCTEEFPSLADLRAFLAFGDGCRNGVCAASTSATAE